MLSCEYLKHCLHLRYYAGNNSDYTLQPTTHNLLRKIFFLIKISPKNVVLLQHTNSDQINRIIAIDSDMSKKLVY